MESGAQSHSVLVSWPEQLTGIGNNCKRKSTGYFRQAIYAAREKSEVQARMRCAKLSSEEVLPINPSDKPVADKKVCFEAVPGELKLVVPDECAMISTLWMPLKSQPEKLLQQHKQLTHSEMVKVISHVQRTQDDWILNTIMIEDCDVPFKYKRKKHYKNLKGQLVNLTYYPGKESVAGIELEIMKVVRIKIA